jgi:hypothetical protein
MSTSLSESAHQQRSRRNLILLALVCIAPVAASYFFYYVWRPEGVRNYGELIAPTPVAEISNAGASGPAASLKGKWVLLMVDSGECAEPCRSKLWQLRQLRLTQGKEMERLERLWIVDDARSPGGALLREYEGTQVLRQEDVPGLAALLKERSPRDHLFVIDPIGNLMMRFPKDPDLNRVKKDLIHLLKVSRIG